ncbi:MAG TPA: AAA family ATPase, partial [Spirochaetia bacterium]|nr:AAA family ATPase [Spirochaetia bacterium]
MFLRSIELFGFKSFADRSRIEFQDGISALLGPNGCGKSNVVDSLKWVLGEQSTRTLRAERMEDVIFNGTENRKALNVAEVTLTLSNDDNLLPIDVAEISLKRRLYRSGESEYYLNNTPIKLRELRELFFDTGIGKSSYSIMEQGKIDQILSSKPEERRYIFEEAAGITKFRVKGAEAERKLERTVENMRQVESILSEVKRSYESLKVQAEKTAVYRKLRDDIFSIELDLLLLRLKGFLEDEHSKEQQLEARVKERDELKGGIDQISDSLEQNLDIVNSMESNLIENQKQLYGIDLEKNNREKQIGMLTERQGELDRQIEAAKSREKNIREKIVQVGEQIAEREKALEESKARLVEVEENIQGFEGSVENAQERIRTNEREVKKREEEIRELEGRQEQLGEELRAITDDIVDELDKRLRESGYSLQRRQEIETSIQSTLSGLRIRIDGRIKILEDRSKLGKNEERERMIEQGVAILQEALAGISSVEGEFSDYRSAIPTFLDEFLAPEGIITRKREIDRNIEEVRRGITEKRDRVVALTEENRNLAVKIDEYRKTLEDLRVNRARMKTQAAAAEEALGMLRRELGEQERHLQEIAEEVVSATKRKSEIAGQMGAAEEERKRLIQDEKRLRGELAQLESGISKRNKELMSKEQQLKKSRATLERLQRQVEELQISLAAVKTEIRTIYENFREVHSRDLAEYESRVYEISTDQKDLRQSLAGARDREKALGQVNLMAPEEFAEVKERFEFLNGQLDDLKKAREDLKSITAEIRTESTELFIDTYDRIRTNFHAMFRRLFGGGRAEIKLLDPDDVLASGIEIYAQPPGKKLENIALLSG